MATQPPEVNSGITTSWLPLTTAYPSIPGCDSAFYVPVNPTAGFLFDPNNANAQLATFCWPSQATIWWNQELDGDVQTSLGPFACPAEYYVASTSILGTSTFSACCASGYTFDGLVNFGNAQQCISTIPPGETLSYTFPSSGGFATTSVKLVQQAVMTAVQINGWNFSPGSGSVTTTVGAGGGISFNPTDFTLESTTTSSSSSSSSSQGSSTTSQGTTNSFSSTPVQTPSTSSSNTASNSSTSTPTPSSGLSSGATIGIAVGCSVLALTAICLIALLLIRRRRNNSRQFQQLSAPQLQLQPPDIAPSQESKLRAGVMGSQPVGLGKSNYHALYEVDGEGRPHEMYSPISGTGKSTTSGMGMGHQEAYELEGMDALTPGARSVRSNMDRSPGGGTEKVLRSEATRYMR